MKRIFLSVFASLLAGAPIFAQGEIDALRYSRNDLTGTARSVAMGGAFGALGGDISAISINPAGIGVYKSSEVVGTLNFTNRESKTNFGPGNLSTSKFKVSFDNLGIVGAFPVNNDDIPFINFGFSYNKLKSYETKYQMRGRNKPISMTDYMAERGNYSEGDVANNSNFNDGDWLGTLGYEGKLTAIGADNWLGSALREDEKINSDLYVKERGEISSYDFNAGTTFMNILSVGASLSVTDLKYRLFSSYQEDFEHGGGFDLMNNLKTDGTGIQLKAGVIFKPIEEIRVGVSYHSPTWYNFTDYYFADLESSKASKTILTPEGRTEYDFKTPDKWTLSLAGIIANRAILSFDYELTNYKDNMNYRDAKRDYFLESSNNAIKQDFKNASAVRVGAEVRITPQFSGRIGYAWTQSAFDDNLKDNIQPAIISGTIPHYMVEGDINHLTWGLGYRFTPNFYVDVAFVVKNQKNDLYMFPKFYEPNTDNLLVASQSGTYKLNEFSGLLTFGFKF